MNAMGGCWAPHASCGRGGRGLAVLFADFRAEEDRLPDVGEGLIERIALADAAGNGGTRDGVAAVRFRGEHNGELHGVAMVGAYTRRIPSLSRSTTAGSTDLI